MSTISILFKAGIARYAPTIKVTIRTVGTQRAVSVKDKHKSNNLISMNALGLKQNNQQLTKRR